MARRFLRDGDFLHAAELLQRGGGELLEKLIWERFNVARDPALIHDALARIPFSLFVTSNYDALLETRLKVSCLTWQDSEAIFAAIKNGRRVVVKTHGDFAKASSLVLTRAQFGKLMHRNDAFTSCLRTLFLLKTVLFVGSSLRDRDILSVMEAAKFTYGKDFGPHFAIMFDDEVDKDYAAFLEESYAIRTILCRVRGESRVPVSAESRTKAVVRILRELSGRAAIGRYKHEGAINISDPLFSQRRSAATLIEQAVKLTGSCRGEICFIEDESRQVLRRAASFSSFDFEAPQGHRPKPLPEIQPFSVIGTLFLKRKLGADFVYISDTEQAASLLASQGFSDATYVECDDRVQSELACPLYADGRRVGVVNLESELKDAYTSDHLAVAQGVSDQAGWVYHQARQLRNSCRSMVPFLNDFAAFRRIMQRSRLLSHLDLHFVLYEIDYLKGRLVARSEVGDTNEFNYRFEESSLATRVLKTRLVDRVPDAEEEIGKLDSRLNRKGVDKFQIRGPVAGIPIQLAGRTVAVMVLWSGQGTKTNHGLFDAACERARRAATLLANDPLLLARDGEAPKIAEGLSARFIERVYSGLDPIDNGALWGVRNVKSRLFRESVTTVLLNALLSEECQLQRVRLWQHTRPNDYSDRVVFICTDSLTTPIATKPGSDPRGAYRRVVGVREDPYCVYTLSRFQHDPHARWQHRSMFGKPDQNCRILDKDPNGSWIVAPIVRLTRPQEDDVPKHRGAGARPEILRGFISADAHAPSKMDSNKFMEQVVADNQARFQLYAVDLVTELLAHVIAHSPPLDGVLMPDGPRSRESLLREFPDGRMETPL